MSGEVSTGSGSDRVTSEASVIIKVRQFITLPKKHVVNCALNAPLIPKVSLATLLRPRAVIMSPTTILPHVSRGVCLESIESPFEFYLSD